MTAYVADVLRQMAVGETREMRNGSKVPATVTKYGPDEFRVSGDMATSYPNTVRVLRSIGLEDVEVESEKDK